MMKPNKFILNSDYLSLAQTNKSEFTAYFLPTTLQPGVAYNQSIDFTVPSSPGAIDMFLISLNNQNYCLGSYITVSTNAPIIEISVYRVNATTMRATLHGFTNQAGGYDMPTQTVKVKVSSFKPPNVF